MKMPEPVAWMYTLEYGEFIADRKVSEHQLNYPFGVCGADYLVRNDYGVSYVRQTPLYDKSALIYTLGEAAQKIAANNTAMTDILAAEIFSMQEAL